MEKQDQENIAHIKGGYNYEKGYYSKLNITTSGSLQNSESSPLFGTNKNTVGEKIWNVISKK